MGTDYSDAKGTLFTDTKKEHLCFIPEQCKECGSVGREGQRLNVCMCRQYGVASNWYFGEEP